jgi:3',5'-nucleoside bisphosphate phosphatase
LIVDLHLHTTASDGRLTPAGLVDRVAVAGVGIMAVTDHDTTGGCREVAARAAAHGIEFVAGIEITAVEHGRDVHMLGYFIDTQHRELERFLVSQREVRIARIGVMAEQLARLGMPVDLTAITDAAGSGRTIGRPLLADAMIAAGYVADRREAFDRWLGTGCPAFVPRDGATPERVIAIIHAAGGLASVAHPGRTRLGDDRLTALVDAGLDAIEVYHSDHDASEIEHYGALADRLGVLRTGGSDYHGDPSHGVSPGGTALPIEHWQRLRAAGYGEPPVRD